MKKSLQALCIIGTALISLGCNQNAATPKSEIKKIETLSPSSATQNYKISEANLSINIPNNFKLEKSTYQTEHPESYPFFSNYEFKPEDKYQFPAGVPSLTGIRFSSKDSITNFSKECNKQEDELSCYGRNFSTPEIYDAEKKAISEKISYKDNQYMLFNSQPYLVKTTQCSGDFCLIRSYKTFVRDIEIEIHTTTWPNGDKYSNKYNDLSDKLFEQITIQTNQ